nr:helix-turn-helix transcriptional regulator [Pectobacterium colocasium]
MKFSTMNEGEIITELCRRIKDARIQQRLSQVDLAERAGLGIATIKRAEMGESITLSSLLSILRGLNRLHQIEGVLFDAEVESSMRRSAVRKTDAAAYQKESCGLSRQGTREA